ncbi:MAG: DUF1993 domain-containing protein [Proteobacteria bacterium]|nr:DUF1993 domain-containing protein [Pseudomonadota bacterium]
MAFSMYDACVPVCAQVMTTLDAILDKAHAQAAAHKLEESAFLQARLFPDMFTMARQVRQATDFARYAPGRLGGVALPDFPATDGADFAALKERVAGSLAFIRSVPAAAIEGTEDKDVVWMQGTNQRSMKGRAYLLHFCLPNLFFHATTAYDLLRHNGVELGKRDFMGTF